MTMTLQESQLALSPDLERLIDTKVAERVAEALQRDPGKNKVAIIASKGTLDMAYPPLILASAAAAMGMDVEIFLTNWGALAFRKGDHRTNTRVSADYEDYRPILLEQMAIKGVTSWMEAIRWQLQS